MKERTTTTSNEINKQKLTPWRRRPPPPPPPQPQATMPAISDPSDDPIAYPDPEPDDIGMEIGGEREGNGGAELGQDHEIDLDKLRMMMWNSFMEQSTVIVNATDDDQKVLRCFDQFLESLPEREPGGAMAGGCPVKFDGVSCWPQTPPGTLRVIPCFDVFNGVYYDPSGEYSGGRGVAVS